MKEGYLVVEEFSSSATLPEPGSNKAKPKRKK
jgi:hypothetical protein